MDVEPVDERDSSWEVDTPRFRVYVFDSRNATSCYDITGAEVLDVVRWAQERCNDDERYAVALVHDDRRSENTRERGLIWLLGYDANTSDHDAVTEARLKAMHARAGQTIVLDE